jgi:hypothetical protein
MASGTKSNGKVSTAPEAEVARATAGPTVVAGSPITLPRMNIQLAQVKLVGLTPLICHRWSEKSRKEMLDKQMGKAKAAKEKKDPARDFWDSLYHLTDNPPAEHREGQRYGFPAIAFKAAAVTACTSVSGITKVQARQAFHISGPDNGELVEIVGVPTMREDMVRIGMGTADIRFRGQFTEWSTVLTIRHNANVLTLEELLNLLKTAGFGVGVGEWRSEKDGAFGQFEPR